MKKTFLVIAILICSSSYSQTYLGLTAGIKSNYGLMPGLYVGHKIGNLLIEGNLKTQAPYEQAVAHGSYFGAGLGYTVQASENVSLAAIGSYYYRLQSTDRKYLNGSDFSFSVRGRYKCFVSETGFIGKDPFFSFGVFSFF